MSPGCVASLNIYRTNKFTVERCRPCKLPAKFSSAMAEGAREVKTYREIFIAIISPILMRKSILNSQEILRFFQDFICSIYPREKIFVHEILKFVNE